MYGCSEGMLRAMFEGRTPWGEPLLNDQDERIDPAMQVISILSDVQELMSFVVETLPPEAMDNEHERLELARQLVNRAKFGICEYLRRPRARTEEGR